MSFNEGLVLWLGCVLCYSCGCPHFIICNRVFTPDYTKEFLYAVPMILFGVPAFLLGLNALVGESRGTEDEFDPDREGGEQ